MADIPYSRWYTDGTVSFTQGSTTVTGVNTYWISAGVKAGDIFVDSNGALYEIAAVNDSTSITLGKSYTGSTGSGKSYSIIRTFNSTMNSKLAQEMSLLIKEFEQRYDLDMKTITGKSAYESAKENGYTGTVSEWLESLTAYGTAVKNGYNGTAAQWIESLSAYGIAVQNGYTGTQAQWIESLKAAGEWTKASSDITALQEENAAIQQDLLAHDSQLQAITPKLSFTQYNGGDIYYSVGRAGLHNSIARGKCLGTTITEEQYNEIHNGTFNDLYIGDFWRLRDGIPVYAIAKFGTSGNKGVILVGYNQRYRALGVSRETGFAGSAYYDYMLNTSTPDLLNSIPEEYIATGAFGISTAIDENGNVTAVKAVDGPAVAPCTVRNIFGSNFGCGGTIPFSYWSRDREEWYPLFRYASTNIYSWWDPGQYSFFESYTGTKVAGYIHNSGGFQYRDMNCSSATVEKILIV